MKKYHTIDFEVDDSRIADKAALEDFLVDLIQTTLLDSAWVRVASPERGVLGLGVMPFKAAPGHVRARGRYPELEKHLPAMPTAAARDLHDLLRALQEEVIQANRRCCCRWLRRFWRSEINLKGAS
jgi:hypothetical protein